MSTLPAFLLLILLLAVNAFFVAVEFALVSSRHDRLEAMAAAGHSRAYKVIDASEHLSMMLATCQLGITVASVLLGKISEPAIAKLLENPLALVGVSGFWLHTIAFIVALIIISYLHILLGEMVPKNFTISSPERTAIIIVPPMLMIMKVSRPLIYFFNALANGTLRLMGVKPRDELERRVTSAQLKAMIGESSGEGLIDDEETRRLDRALEASDRPVRTIMIPVHRMRTLELKEGQITLESLQKLVQETGYSRYPVKNDIGHYLGFLHIKDVLDYLYSDELSGKPIPANLIRPLLTFPGDSSIDSVSARMRRLRSHLALVTDPETDQIIGFVALEDLMEEFVGTVRDSTHKIPE
ncbi:hemolysin family protein [Lawsonella clevelandensis]|uniref:Magnesium and cobalt efflux protein CorC n=1 Tax=Lawsonella clevelandensis TaxID=1528099 RepID=A0A5E3ZUN3_9ACTN|nr:hemolysin family protein [Lawsonella clevelandensis]VHN99414.1 Magnesium and cobalt efflux protein CorC [Lawsonella clevelandensis]